jgi:hypothetical protein
MPLIETAFSEDEQLFYEHQGDIAAFRTHFDCTRTHKELEEAGIAAPVFDDAMLALCLTSMQARDEEVHALAATSKRENRRAGGMRHS